MKTYSIISDNTSWLRSIESANLKITNPKTNKSIWIRKHKMSEFSKEDRELVFKCVGNEFLGDANRVMELTKKEVETLYKLSKF